MNNADIHYNEKEKFYNTHLKGLIEGKEKKIINVTIRIIVPMSTWKESPTEFWEDSTQWIHGFLKVDLSLSLLFLGCLNKYFLLLLSTFSYFLRFYKHLRILWL